MGALRHNGSRLFFDASDVRSKSIVSTPRSTDGELTQEAAEILDPERGTWFDTCPGRAAKYLLICRSRMREKSVAAGGDHGRIIEPKLRPRTRKQDLGRWKKSRLTSMGDRLESSGQRLAGLLKAGNFDTAQALLRTNLTGRARSLQDDVLLALFESPPPETALGAVAEALLGLAPDADGFSALAEHLEANGAALAAQAAQRCAAELDFDAHPAMDVWGGAFNGQARRQALFDQLLHELKIVTIVETGTFRGTSTAYMAKAGLPVFSCELWLRYFHYSLLRLANMPNVRLERADSRRFLRELFDENLLPPGPAFFYLDAHWESDLPVWEELDQIFSRHPSPVIMVDDFRVPTDSGFAYDDYGKGKCLSVSNLHEAVTARPSVFFPNHASAHETGARRGCVVLAQGDLAHSIRREVPMLTELSWIDALILDGVGELRNDLARVALGAVGTASREQELACSLADERQAHAESKARLELRAHELSSAVARAEFIQHQRELEAEDAKRDAAAAREAATGFQTLVLRLHEELSSARTATMELQQTLRRELEAENAKRDAAAAREAATGFQTLVLRLHEELSSARTATMELQQTLRLAEERAEHAVEQVAELQHSRWRRIGRLLGLARKATFER